MKRTRQPRLILIVRRAIVGAVAVGSTAVTLAPGGYLADIASAMGTTRTTNSRPTSAGAVESTWPESGEAQDAMPSVMPTMADGRMAPMPAHSTNP